MPVGTISNRVAKKVISKATPEQLERARRGAQEKVLVEEMGVNPALAKQVVDGDITVAEAELRTANQNNKLGFGEQAEAVDDVGYINQVRAADPDGIKLYEIKQNLPDAEKNKLTMAEIAYKKGDPKPLATMYRTLGIAGAVGAGSALASEDAEAAPALLLRKGLDATTAGRQIKNKMNREGTEGGRTVQDYIHKESNYDNGFTDEARRWDEGNNGPTYVYGIKKMAYDLIQGTDDPQVKKAVMAWLNPRLQRAAVATGAVGMAGAAAAGEEEYPVPAAIELADVVWKESGSLDGISNETQFERADTPAVYDFSEGIEEFKKSIEGKPAEEYDFREGIEQFKQEIGKDEDFDTSSEYLLKSGLRTIFQGASFGLGDELEGGIQALLTDTPYEEAVSRIRQSIDDYEAGYPGSALIGELSGAVPSSLGFYKQAMKRGATEAGAAGLEGYIYGAADGESLEERAFNAGVGFAAGATIGRGLDWLSSSSKRANTASREGARTQADDQLDDGILTQNIELAAEEKASIVYKVGGGEGDLQKAKVIKFDKKKGLVTLESDGKRFTVPQRAVEKIDVDTDDLIGQYERLQDFDNARGQYKPRRQVIDYEETVKQGRTADDPIMRDATWRDATTAGELWDGMKDGVKKWYDQKLTGADDMLSRRVSKAVGARFARASQNAVRWSTNAFTQVAEPLRGVAKLADDDRYFKAMVMDFTNARKLTQEGKKPPTQDEVEGYIRKNLGEEDVKAFRDYMDWNRKKKADHVDKLNGREAFKEYDHIHTQLNKQGKEKLFKGKKREDDDALSDLKREEMALRDDGALEYRNRGSMVDGLNNNNSDVLGVDDYFNPFFSDFRRTSNLEALYQLAKVFGLDTADESFQPSQVFDRIEKSLIDRGIEPKAAKLAADTMKDDFVGGSKTPNNWIQALNSVGYMGSLAGPKSAILNVHDILVAGSVYGGKSMRSLFDDMGYSVSKKGIVQNVGEFRDDMINAYRQGDYESGALARDLTRKGTDALMKGSGFAALDRVGKKGVTKMVIQDAVDNVDNLADRWGFYFSKRELDLIEKQIRKHGTDVGSMTGKGAELFEELFFAGLGQQQLISSSGRPAAWSRNPNARFMWALRGFAIKQQALLLREITDKIAEGKTKEAAKFMGRYAAFAAGGFGFVNESRQWLMGDGEFTFHGMLMGAGDQIVSTMSINTIGLNDYQWGRMMRNGVTLTFLESVIPIGIDIPKDMVLDVVDAADGTIKGESGFTPAQRVAYPVAQLPIIKQPVRLLSNLEDNVGLPNPMRQFTDMYIETELPKDG